MEEEQKKLDLFLEENNLKIGYRIDFPQYRILPDEVKLAMSILNTHKMRIQIILTKGDAEAEE